MTGQKFDKQNLIDLYETWDCDGGQCGDSGLGNWELGELLAKATGKNAQIIGYLGMAIYHYSGDWDKDHTKGIVNLKQDWYVGLDLRKIMGDWLKKGNYLIVAGVLNQFTPSKDNPEGRRMVGNHPPGGHAGAQFVGHWVVVRSINGDNISIVNPFYNRLEWYSWSGVFRSSMMNMHNSLVCIDPFKNGSCDRSQ